MRRSGIITALTGFALLVHGYHPYGEDGGLYIAGIKKLLNPALYPYWTAFVTEHLRFSLFAPLVAGLVRLMHIGLEPVLLLLYVAGIWSTLFAGWMLVARTGAGPRACAGGAALLACWLDLPIAGTSQMLMDPYVTARTFTTPLTLLAAAWALGWARGWALGWAGDWAGGWAGGWARERRNGWWCAAAILFATLIHPLMAGYALAVVLVLLCTASPDRRLRHYGPWVLLVLALLSANLLAVHAPRESPDYVRVSMTRYYWFPFRWEWYEQLGLVAPLAVLALLLRAQKGPPSGGYLIKATMILAGISLTVAAGFCRAGTANHLVARMQPLRLYGFVYAVMTLLLGAWLAEYALHRKVWRWALLLGGMGAVMFYVQRSTYPASAHLELPGRTPRNPYVQAFLWARRNTPNAALFALDARYITRDGEDAQPFRALAERSALADYSKDGGEASITPELTGAWVLGQAAQRGLEEKSDAERVEALRPLGVGWVVLRQASATAWLCPYRNATVKVCRLP